MTGNRVIEATGFVLENTHRLLLKVSGGRLLRRVLGMEPVEIHTIGRRSGARRSTLLTAPICESNRVVLVASKGGHEHHPAWYLNLLAHPEIDITVRGSTRTLIARTADPMERAELWPLIVGAYRGYGEYQRNTAREIPVVICEPER